jgi:NADPH2:quinone reductase
MAPALPAVLGNGVGGVVAAVGEGVDPDLVGARVVTSLGGSGGYAERAVADAASLVRVPENLELADAVALLADGRTALALIQAAPPRAGETVLVEAAAGGVGSLLVQLARNAGARVVAAAGGERKLDVARGLGAEVVVDYTDPDWPRTVEPVDVVFDGVGGEIGAAAFALVRPGGRFVSFGLASGAFTRVDADEADRRGVTVVRGTGASPEDLVALTRDALEEAAAGRLRPLIGQTFPLERASDAHAAMEVRATVGKTLLLV